MSVVLPEYGGCLWPADPACLGDKWDALDEAVQKRALALASSALRRLTAFRVGGCPIVVRPCAPRCQIPAFVPFHGSYGADWIQPGINVHGQWVNACGCSGNCDCTTACEISLPAPVGEVYAVKVDGAVIPASDYRVDNGHILVWIGTGDCPFPATQDLTKDDTEVGTFSIEYLNAYPVDELGAVAAAALALEFAEACKPKGRCSLPRQVTEVIRNGVSFTITAGMFPGGFTNIDVVDGFIEIWNPEGRTQQSRVWYPGMKRPRHQTA